MVFDLMRMISTQICWQDSLLISLQVVRTSSGFHLRECMRSSFPPPPPDNYMKNKLSYLPDIYGHKTVHWRRTGK